ncbi:MAG: RNA methyltransferase [Geminicoccaceae bacterium]|nr:MAG: RNA methyltransferase [Geminicoccaceae bacterium]
MAGTDRRFDVPAGPMPVVVLVRPQMGENVGTAARAMLNFGLTELRLVDPLCGWPNAKAVNAASGASVVLNQLEIFETTAAAVADLHRVYATTARPRDMTIEVLTAEAAACDMRRQLGAGQRVGVLFGPERTGLENDDIALADAVLTVPLNPGFSSLNLAQAVVLVAYEWFKGGDGTPPRIEPGADALAPATKGEVEALLNHVVTELEGTAFFRSEDRRAKRIEELRLLLERRQLRSVEVQTLRGMVKGLTQERRPPRSRG